MLHLSCLFSGFFCYDDDYIVIIAGTIVHIIAHCYTTHISVVLVLIHFHVKSFWFNVFLDKDTQHNIVYEQTDIHDLCFERFYNSLPGKLHR